MKGWIINKDELILDRIRGMKTGDRYHEGHVGRPGRGIREDATAAAYARCDIRVELTCRRLSER